MVPLCSLYRVTPNKDTLYISEVNEARKVKSDVQVDMNKN